MDILLSNTKMIEDVGLDQNSKTGQSVSQKANCILDQTVAPKSSEELQTSTLSPRTGPPSRQMPPSLSQIEGIFKDSDKSEQANSINPKKKSQYGVPKKSISKLNAAATSQKRKILKN